MGWLENGGWHLEIGVVFLALALVFGEILTLFHIPDHFLCTGSGFLANLNISDLILSNSEQVTDFERFCDEVSGLKMDSTKLWF